MCTQLPESWVVFEYQSVNVFIEDLCTILILISTDIGNLKVPGADFTTSYYTVLVATDFNWMDFFSGNGQFFYAYSYMLQMKCWNAVDNLWNDWSLRLVQ